MSQPLDVIELGHRPPLALDQRLRLRPGVTFVVGPSGSGKSEVAEAVLAAVSQRPGLRDVMPGVDLSWTAGVRDWGEMPSGGRLWPPLEALWAGFDAAQRVHLEAEVQAQVRALLQIKVASGQSKFAAVARTSDEVCVQLGEGGCVEVTTIGGIRIASLFQAAGEQVVLYLALVAATRRVMRLEGPFVWGEGLDFLDGLLRGSCRAAICAMAPQVLVVLNPQERSELEVQPHYALVPMVGSERFKLVDTLA